MEVFGGSANWRSSGNHTPSAHSRIPDLDTGTASRETLGWRCDAADGLEAVTLSDGHSGNHASLPGGSSGGNGGAHCGGHFVKHTRWPTAPSFRILKRCSKLTRFVCTGAELVQSQVLPMRLVPMANPCLQGKLLVLYSGHKHNMMF